MPACRHDPAVNHAVLTFLLCPQYFDSVYSPNAPGFDNLAFSMLTVFQCMTLSGWNFVMYRVIDGTTYVSVIYFVMLIIFGPYFILNLFLAVLKIKFAKAQTLLHARLKRDRTRHQGRIARLAGNIYRSLEALIVERLMSDPINDRLMTIDNKKQVDAGAVWACRHPIYHINPP